MALINVPCHMANGFDFAHPRAKVRVPGKPGEVQVEHWWQLNELRLDDRVVMDRTEPMPPGPKTKHARIGLIAPAAAPKVAKPAPAPAPAPAPTPEVVTSAEPAKAEPTPSPPAKKRRKGK